jgi:hypothetical protein
MHFETSQDIIKYLHHELQWDFAHIGRLVGATRVSISNIYHGKQTGVRIFHKLLLQVPSTEIDFSSEDLPPRPSDTPPKDVQRGLELRKQGYQDFEIRERLAQEAEYEEALEKWEEWEEFAPVAARIDQAIEGMRGKVVENILPDGYSIVKTPDSLAGEKQKQKKRVIQRNPRSKKPRRPRIVESTVTHLPQSTSSSVGYTDLIIMGISFLKEWFRPKQETTQKQLPSPKQTQQEAILQMGIASEERNHRNAIFDHAQHARRTWPIGVPVYPPQTQPELKLAYAKTPQTNVLGYTSNYQETPQDATYENFRVNLNIQRR